MVLATAVGRTEAREGTDFFPLTVDIEEKMYAAGKIPGGFFKREGRAAREGDPERAHGRPADPAAAGPRASATRCRSSARCCRPTASHAHDVLAINGASAALMLSPLPFLGPVGAVRVGRIEGELVVNPTHARDGRVAAST